MTTNVLFHHPAPGAGFDPDPVATRRTGARLHLPTRPGNGGAVALVGTPAHDDDVPWIPDHLRPAVRSMRADRDAALAMLAEQVEGTRGDVGMVCAGPDDDALLATDTGLANRLTTMMVEAFSSGAGGWPPTSSPST